MAVLSPALITTLIDSAYRVSFTTEYYASHPVTEVSCVQLCQQCIPLLNALLSSSPSLTLLCLSSFCSSQLSQWCHVFLLKPQNHAWPLSSLRLLLPFPFICKSTQCAVSGATLLTPFLSYSHTALQQPFWSTPGLSRYPLGSPCILRLPVLAAASPAVVRVTLPSEAILPLPISMFFPYSLLSFAEEILCRAFLISKSFNIAFWSCLLSSSYLQYSHL